MVVLGLVGVVFGAVSNGDPRNVASNVLLSFGIAFFIAAFVAFITNQNVDYRNQTLTGVERPRRRQMRRAVMRGEAHALPTSDRQLAFDFADAHVASAPPAISPSFLILSAFLFQSAAQLVQWDGDWASWLLLAKFILILIVIIVVIPLQIRWLRNAETLSGRVGAQ